MTGLERRTLQAGQKSGQKKVAYGKQQYYVKVGREKGDRWKEGHRRWGRKKLHMENSNTK